MKLSKSLEDYLEKILLLCLESEGTGITDLARELNVKKSSAFSAVNKLKKEKLIEQHHYGKISLTRAGYDYAERVLSRHLILKRFFINFLRVDKKNAERDACRIEHSISEESLRNLILFTNYLQEHDEKCLKEYAKYKSKLNEKGTKIVSLDSMEFGTTGVVYRFENIKSNDRKVLIKKGILKNLEIKVIGKTNNEIEVETGDKLTTITRRIAINIKVSVK